jgi:hypothetical protein
MRSYSKELVEGESKIVYHVYAMTIGSSSRSAVSTGFETPEQRESAVFNADVKIDEGADMIGDDQLIMLGINPRDLDPPEE